MEEGGTCEPPDVTLKRPDTRSQGEQWANVQRIHHVLSERVFRDLDERCALHSDTYGRDADTVTDFLFTLKFKR